MATKTTETTTSRKRRTPSLGVLRVLCGQDCVFVAYSQLGPLRATLDPKSFTIATFALCGFANFSSIGIPVGGIGALTATFAGMLL